MPHDEESQADKVDRLAHRQNVMGEERNDPAHPAHPQHFLLRKPNRITVSGGAEPKPPTKMVVSGDEIIDKKKI